METHNLWPFESDLFHLAYFFWIFWIKLLWTSMYTCLSICFKLFQVDNSCEFSGWYNFSVVQSLRRVWLFATPWTAGHQVSLSFTISWSLVKLMSTESVMPSSDLPHCCIIPCLTFRVKLSAILLKIFFNLKTGSWNLSKILLLYSAIAPL